MVAPPRSEGHREMRVMEMSDAIVEATLGSLCALLLALCERVALWALGAAVLALCLALATWELR